MKRPKGNIYIHTYIYVKRTFIYLKNFNNKNITHKNEENADILQDTLMASKDMKIWSM